MIVLGYILLAVGFMGCLYWQVRFLVLAYNQSLWWCFGCLFVPFVDWFFLFLNFKVAVKPFGLSLLGLLVAGLVATWRGSCGPHDMTRSYNKRGAGKGGVADLWRAGPSWPALPDRERSAMVHLPRMITSLILALGLIGCRSADPDRSYRAWLFDNFRREAAAHKHVLLVCIYESRFEWKPLPSYHHLDCKGIVVRSYKGTWGVGERIALHHELESAPKEWQPPVGYLEYLLVDEHSAEPIGVDVGEDWEYTPEFGRRVAQLYARESNR